MFYYLIIGVILAVNHFIMVYIFKDIVTKRILQAVDLKEIANQQQNLFGESIKHYLIFFIPVFRWIVFCFTAWIIIASDEQWESFLEKIK